MKKNYNAKSRPCAGKGLRSFLLSFIPCGPKQKHRRERSPVCALQYSSHGNTSAEKNDTWQMTISQVRKTGKVCSG